ncbi:MAG: hypothetical protein KGY54_07710, partial [Oleiphilaceae bacterium]|nr:hypothetical protein [Oleiphilaceae bacterium]
REARIAQTKREFVQWGKAISDSRPGQPPVNVHFSVITFSQVEDPDARKRYNSLPNANLAVSDVDDLRVLAGRLLKQSREYNAFLAAIRAR